MILKRRRGEDEEKVKGGDKTAISAEGEEEKQVISFTRKNPHSMDPGSQEEGETETWERRKTQQKRIEDVRNTIDLERGMQRSPQRKRNGQAEGQDTEKRARKLKFEVR